MLRTNYRNNVEPLGYKAFLVGVDRSACAKYKVALDQILLAEVFGELGHFERAAPTVFPLADLRSSSPLRLGFAVTARRPTDPHQREE